MNKMVWIYQLATCKDQSYGIESLHVILRKVNRIDSKVQAANECLNKYGTEYADKARKICAATGQYDYFYCFGRNDLELHFQRNTVDAVGDGWYGGRLEGGQFTPEVAKGILKISTVSKDNPQACLDVLKALPVEYQGDVSEFVPASLETIDKYREMLLRGKTNA